MRKRRIAQKLRWVLVGAIILVAAGWADGSKAGPAFTALDIKLPGGLVEFSSPTLADLDGDGRPEVLVGTTAHNGSTGAYDRPAGLAAVRGDGTLLWWRDFGAPINSAPAVGDIDGDGWPEVVVSLGGDDADRRHHGGVAALDRFGNVLWVFRTQDQDGDGFADGVFSSPTLCDVDGDGKLEVIFGAWDQRIYVLDNAGRVRWQNLPSGFPGPGYYNADSVWSTAACADFNGDGRKEIVIGADITGGGVLPDGTVTEDGGFLYIFDGDGRVLVRRYLPEAIYAAPAVGDLDGDGRLEIVVGTAWYWWNRHGRTAQPYVYVFDTQRVFDGGLRYDDPAKLPDHPGWPRPTTYPGFSSPALADLDGDGLPEVIIGTGHPDLQGPDDIPGAGEVYVWRHDGSLLPGWPIFRPKNARGQDGPVFSSPTAADVDGDGRPEVLFSTLWDVQVYRWDGSLLARLETFWTVWGSPAVGDTDGDGRMEVWVGGSKHPAVGGDPAHGYLWRFSTTAATSGPRPWPMFHRDPVHSGLHPRPARLEAGPSPLAVLYPQGASAAEAWLWLRNSGDEAPLSWWVSRHPAGVGLSPSGGTLRAGERMPVRVMVEAGNYRAGVYNLGPVTFAATMGGTFEVPLRLVVGQVFHAYLPLVVGR